MQLSLSNVRRRRQVTCHSCGTRLDIVVPTAVYSLVTLSAVILGSMLVPVLLMSIFEKKWAAIALAIALLFALIFGSNELLNRRATVQRADARITKP